MGIKRAFSRNGHLGSVIERAGRIMPGSPIMVLAAAIACLPLAALAGQNTDGWQAVKQFNALKPATPDEARISKLWDTYGNKPLEDAVALPLTYAVLNYKGRETIVGIAMGTGCQDDTPNDKGSTQLHTVCPATAITTQSDGQVKATSVDKACWMWTAGLPPSRETDPARNATFVRMDKAGGKIDLKTLRNGVPLAECSAKLSIE